MNVQAGIMQNPIKQLFDSASDNYDLMDWRNWFSRMMAFIICMLLPLSYYYSFPPYIASARYHLIVIDSVFWIFLLLLAFVRPVYLFAGRFAWPLILYILTVLFFASLGPDYARPGWLVLCSVIMAVFFGVSGALVSALLNALILISLYYLVDSASTEWVQVREAGLSNWLNFAVNLGLVAFGASLSVAFLINRLNSSLQNERGVKIELQAANEELNATNEELEAMNEEFAAQNSELVLSTKELEDIGEYNRILFADSVVPMAVIDPESGKFTDCNTMILRVFGFTIKSELVGLSPADLSPRIQYDGSESAAAFQKQLARASQESVAVYPWLHLKKDGSVWDAEIYLMRFRLRETTMLHYTLWDISDRVKAEEENRLAQMQLVHVQKMEAIGTLAGGIAHDFNNILGGIIGSLDLLGMHLEKENLAGREKIRSYLATAHSSSRRAADLVRQLLDVSRKKEMSVENISVDTCVRNVINICRNSFPKSIEIVWDKPQNSVIVRADAAQIEQVLLNLCVNASHSMTIMRSHGEAGGGRILIETDCISGDARFCALHPGAKRDLSYAKIRISDNGVGIPEDQLGHIFEPFYTTKAVDEGTGLGLSISYNILSQHDGFIDVQSKSGEGTDFYVYLPAVENKCDQSDTNKKPFRVGSGLILVVDDEESVLKVTCAILEQCGYRTLYAQDPLIGLRIFSENHSQIDAVILDNSMPHMSGPELFEEMKKIDPQIRAMLSSGNMEDDKIQHCRQIGIREFIDKPFTVSDLSEKTSALLSN